MAIVRIPRKYKEFEYENTKFAIRPARTEEVMEATRMITLYQKTVRIDLSEDVKSGIGEYSAATGDMTLMLDVQRYVAKTLVVDFVSHEQLFGEGGEKVEDAPADFIAAAFQSYSQQDRSFMLSTVIDRLDLSEEAVKKINASAIINRPALVSALGELYKAEDVTEFINILDGKLIVRGPKVIPEEAKTVTDPSQAVSTTTSGFEGQ